jgi:hypothetical protein
MACHVSRVSRTKFVRIFGRTVAVFDNSHDVVVARMVEAARELPELDAERIHNWSVWASVADLGFDLDSCTDVERAAIGIALVRARGAIEAHGDVVQSDLVGWSVLPGFDVSGGFLRWEPRPVVAVLDVVDGFEEMLENRLAPDPPDGRWWSLGYIEGNGRHRASSR